MVSEQVYCYKVGYHRRSLDETAMYRIPCFSNGVLFGPTLKNRNEDTQKAEAKLRYKNLNRFTKLGMPNFKFGKLRNKTGTHSKKSHPVSFLGDFRFFFFFCSA